MRHLLMAGWWATGLMLGASVAHAQAPTVIRLGYSNVSGFTAMWVARDQGMFARHGLDVQPVLIALNSTMPAALVGGSLQIASPSPPVFLQAVEGGLDIVVISGCSSNDTSQSGQGVVARTGVVIRARCRGSHSPSRARAIPQPGPCAVAAGWPRMTASPRHSCNRRWPHTACHQPSHSSQRCLQPDPVVQESARPSWI